MKTLYISDLDGTLLNSEGKLTDESAEMLNKAIEGGALFSIATARTPGTVAEIMKGVKANLPYIVMTGGALWNPADRGFSHIKSIPSHEAEKILGVFLRHSVPVFIYCFQEGKIHIYHKGPLSPQEIEFMKGKEGEFKTFHVPADGESTLPEPLPDVALFYSIRTSEASRPAYEEIKATCRCSPLYYQDIYGDRVNVLEAFSPEATKAKAIRRLKELTGADRVVAFGDNVNDLPMLREADMAVAVENAIPEVKEMADIVIGPNTAGSVARFILTDSQFSNHEI
ncbi:MAG: Cof-type HAD-IIB family hydrolase [Muribaculaceae bacterium]|nr:Cof-type HAD-IIB family hydrolase [Muribaculaceae bacterium]